MKTLQDARLAVASLQGSVSSKREARTRLALQIEEIEGRIPILRDAIALAKACLDECLELRGQMEELVTAGLRDSFEKDYTFVLEADLDDNNTVKGLRPKISAPDGQLADPRDDIGAGVLSVAAIFLLAAVVLVGGKTRALLVLDEQLATLKIERWRRVAEVLESLCRDTGLQIIFFTHFAEPFGKVYKVEKRRLRKGEEASFVFPVEKAYDERTGQWTWVEVPEEAA